MIVPYEAEWPILFARLGCALRAALGDVALRIDHIGSTSVPGAATETWTSMMGFASRFEPLDAFRSSLRYCSAIICAPTQRTRDATPK
jgi:hypothetical protein